MAEKVEKERLDVLLVQQGLANSRELAKAYIMAGNVYVDGQKEDKAGTKVAVTAKLEVKGNQMKYVSRGGYKLEKAMDVFGIRLDGKICLDIGASTGGFTDCMLQNGASKVYAIDVGYGQFAWKLRNDERVVCRRTGEGRQEGRCSGQQRASRGHRDDCGVCPHTEPWDSRSGFLPD